MVLESFDWGKVMKKLLLILALALSANAWTSISGDVHEKCKDAKDYVGCMKFYSEDALIEKNNKLEHFCE